MMQSSTRSVVFDYAFYPNLSFISSDCLIILLTYLGTLFISGRKLIAIVLNYRTILTLDVYTANAIASLLLSPIE